MRPPDPKPDKAHALPEDQGGLITSLTAGSQCFKAGQLLSLSPRARSTGGVHFRAGGVHIRAVKVDVEAGQGTFAGSLSGSGSGNLRRFLLPVVGQGTFTGSLSKDREPSQAPCPNQVAPDREPSQGPCPVPGSRTRSRSYSRGRGRSLVVVVVVF